MKLAWDTSFKKLWSLEFHKSRKFLEELKITANYSRKIVYHGVSDTGFQVTELRIVCDLNLEGRYRH
jgi:phage-related protein